jgi:hypothetical protein
MFSQETLLDSPCRTTDEPGILTKNLLAGPGSRVSMMPGNLARLSGVSRVAAAEHSALFYRVDPFAIGWVDIVKRRAPSTAAITFSGDPLP